MLTALAAVLLLIIGLMSVHEMNSHAHGQDDQCEEAVVIDLAAADSLDDACQQLGDDMVVAYIYTEPGWSGANMRCANPVVSEDGVIRVLSTSGVTSTYLGSGWRLP